MSEAPGRAQPPPAVRWVAALALSCSACGRVGYDFLPFSGFGGTREKSGSDAGVRHLPDGGVSGGASSGSSAGGGGSGGLDATTQVATGGAAGAEAGAAAGGNAGSGGAPDGSACTLVPLVLTDWCTELPELARPAVIDGVLECPLELRPLSPEGWTGPGTPDATAEYAVAWDSSGLYFFVAVHDPLVVPAAPADPLWEGDAVEIYVDSDGVYSAPPAFDDPGSRQFVVAASSGTTPSTRATYYTQGAVLGGNWTSTRFAAYPTSDGYAVEAVVVAADLGLTTWNPAANSTVGFDLAVDVSFPTATQTGNEGHRLGQYFLHLAPGTNRAPYTDVAGFCDPALVAR